MSILALLLTLVIAVMGGKTEANAYAACEKHFRYAPCVVSDEGTFRLVTSWHPYKGVQLNTQNVIPLGTTNNPESYVVIR